MKNNAFDLNNNIQNLIKAWIIFAILLIAAIIGLSKLWQIKHRGTPLDSASIFKTDISFAVDDTGIHDRIEANYLAYLNRAYILFGEYPNCEYIKIYDNRTGELFDDIMTDDAYNYGDKVVIPTEFALKDLHDWATYSGYWYFHQITEVGTWSFNENENVYERAGD